VAPGTVMKVARQAVVRVVESPGQSDTARPTGTTDESSTGAQD